MALPTGGSITTDGDYTVHTFSLAQTGTNFVPTKAGNVAVLVVAGGGGSGGSSNSGSRGGGGGGAGGYLYEASHAVTAQPYIVTVGAKGTGATGAELAGVSGGDSDFDDITSTGGGAGGGVAAAPPSTGGSGGGGGSGPTSSNGAAGTGGQGSAGGNGTTTEQRTGGSGGGSAGAGGNAGSGDVAGGAGTANSISGASYTYAKGGDCNYGVLNNVGNLPGEFYGDGGEGGWGGFGGLDGKEGIVIVRYLTTDFFIASSSATGYTYFM